MTLTSLEIKKIIKKLFAGEDYRIVVISILNEIFLQFCIDFFKKIINAKLDNKHLPIDWYKKELLNPNLSKEEIALNSGLNNKTIGNMFGSTRKEVVIEASELHYDSLLSTIDELIDMDSEIDLELSIRLRGVIVQLNINESLVVINALAVKRSAIRGGLWSAAGKGVEKPLMVTLCRLFKVPESCYSRESIYEVKTDTDREADFYLNNGEKQFRCEVKLMGKGNPESADGVFARKSKVFIANKLSDLNKRQLDEEKIEWVELRSENGYRKFGDILSNLGIEHSNLPDDVENRIDIILTKILNV